jgi:hypothetical protein
MSLETKSMIHDNSTNQITPYRCAHNIAHDHYMPNELLVSQGGGRNF